MPTLIENIMSHCIDSNSYGRMFDFKCNVFEDYEGFMEWNIKCLEEMSHEDQVWMWDLCKRLKDCNIGMMDLEECGIWTADQFFFDKNKKICIVHPR